MKATDYHEIYMQETDWILILTLYESDYLLIKSSN